MATGDTPQARVVSTSKRYLRDADRTRKRSKDMARLVAVVDALRHGHPLDARHHDHALVGNWSGHRECHIQADWLLIYRIDKEAVYLDRTGTHSDLFG